MKPYKEKPDLDEALSEEEVAKRRDAALTRALKTPPKPRGGGKKMSKDEEAKPS